MIGSKERWVLSKHKLRMMRYIQDYNFSHKKALIRVDFNVPLDDNCRMLDEVRINRTLPTIRKVLKDGGAAILLSHLGRPKQGYEVRFSLKKFVNYLTNRLGTQVKFAETCLGMGTQEKVHDLQPGEVLLLENVRFYPEEIAGDLNFAQALASLGNVYINDAFATAHRAHASTTVVPRYFKDKLAGYLMQQEIHHTDSILLHAKKPFTVIIGGAKITDKLQPIASLLDKVDILLIGGGVANIFQQARSVRLATKLPIGDQVAFAWHLAEKAKQKDVSLLLPTDVVIVPQRDKQAHRMLVHSNAVPTGWIALDIGPKTQAVFANVIQKAKTIFWSGPIGVVEMPHFRQGTQAVAAAIATATTQGAFSLIGGGDSAAAMKQLGYHDKVSYISTGGGALLAYIAANKDLPGIKALHETN